MDRLGVIQKTQSPPLPIKTYAFLAACYKNKDSLSRQLSPQVLTFQAADKFLFSQLPLQFKTFDSQLVSHSTAADVRMLRHAFWDAVMNPIIRHE